MKKIRVGIIGTGFGAKVHAPMLNFHNNFEVVSISSVSRGNIEEVKAVSGIENVYTNWREMLDQETVDLIIIASAVHLHHDMVLAAYEKGVHVLCEKPMALHSSETEKMIFAKETAKKLGLINHEFRFLPARTKVKEIIDNGALGKILHVRYLCSYASYTALMTRTRGWLGQEDKGGGMLGALGSHMTDSLQWWMSSTFTEVFSQLPIHVPIQVDETGTTETRTADDSFQIIGELENGATVTMELISAARQTADSWRLEVFGTNGTLIMLNDNKVLFSSGDLPLTEVELIPDLQAPLDMPEIAARYYNGFNRMLDALYETIDTNTKHPYLADFENGHMTQKVLDAVRLSAREGRKVKII
jgi:predicted dehydrogenase